MVLIKISKSSMVVLVIVFFLFASRNVFGRALVSSEEGVVGVSQDGKQTFRFGQSTNYTEGSRAYYQGTVYNDGKREKRFVKVEIRFYDARKELLMIEDAYTKPEHIRAGGSASYSISIDASVPVSTYDTHARWK